MYLRTKQLVSFIAVALLPLLVLSLVGYTLVRSLLIERVTDEMFAFVDAMVAEKQDEIERFTSLVNQTAEYPPIQGIIRAQETGTDDIDESSVEQWKDRLAQLFESSVRNSNGRIRQIRFIDENGIEVVNVTSKGSTVRRVGEIELQDKSESAYFSETMALAPRSIYVSPIELNREYGVIEIPYVPVLRVATPIIDERDSSKEGIIVINVLADKVFGDQRIAGGLTIDFSVVDENGRYVYSSDSELEFLHLLNPDAPTLADTHAEFAENVAIREGYTHTDTARKELHVWRKVRYAPQAPDRFYVLLAVIDEQELLAPVARLDRTMLLIAGFALLVSLLLSTYLSRSLTKPILRLKTTVERIARGKFDERSDIDDDSEIGELADDVNRMAAELGDSYRELEQRVEQRTSELSALIDNVPVGIFLIDAQTGLLRIVNENATRIIGANLVEGRPYLTLAGTTYLREDGTPYPLGDLPSVKALESGGVHRVDDVYVRADDGSLRNVLKIAVATEQGGKVSGAIVATYDRSKERQIDRQKDEFVSFAAHQLKTPPQSIMWIAQSLLDDSKKLTASQRQGLEDIEEVSRTMLKTVQMFLDISRLELDTFTVKPEDVTLRDVIDEAIGGHAKKASEKSVKMTVKASKRMRVTADRSLLRTVIENLVSNAVKYTPEKGRVRIETVQDESGTRISVSDTGIGIPKAEQEKIFAKSFRAKNVGDVDGTGFGLYLVRETLRKTGCDVTFVSEEGTGSTFTVTVPPDGMRPKEGTTRIS